MKIDYLPIILFSVLIVLEGCDRSITSGPDLWNLDANVQASGCGGFDTMLGKSKIKSVENDECGDERLIWQYDKELMILRLLNKDVFLNCCGEHSITVSMNGETGIYIIDEVDKPESNGGRCSCMCLFDFMIDLEDIELGRINVELYRHVYPHTTSQEPRSKMVWEGELKLGKGTGNELIEKNVGSCN